MIEIDGVQVTAQEEGEARLMRHDPVERPTRDQEVRWHRQLAEEEPELPFEDD